MIDLVEAVVKSWILGGVMLMIGAIAGAYVRDEWEGSDFLERLMLIWVGGVSLTLLSIGFLGLSMPFLVIFRWISR